MQGDPPGELVDGVSRSLECKVHVVGPHSGVDYCLPFIAMYDLEGVGVHPVECPGTRSDKGSKGVFNLRLTDVPIEPLLVNKPKKRKDRLQE